MINELQNDLPVQCLLFFCCFFILRWTNDQVMETNPSHSTTNYKHSLLFVLHTFKQTLYLKLYLCQDSGQFNMLLMKCSCLYMDLYTWIWKPLLTKKWMMMMMATEEFLLFQFKKISNFCLLMLNYVKFKVWELDEDFGYCCNFFYYNNIHTSKVSNKKYKQIN